MTETTREPSTSQRAAIENRTTAAYWYAVGMADGTGEHDRSWEFRTFHAEQAWAYYVDESRTFLPSVPDAFREFLATVAR